MAESFVYCWTDHKRSKLYIGYHKGSPDDGYVCSSKRMLKNNPLKTKHKCPHCDYYGPKARWHWDNCKNKGEVSSLFSLQSPPQ